MVTELKKELNDLQKYYGDDRPLDEYREISDKDFGRITTNHDMIEGAEDVLESDGEK